MRLLPLILLLIPALSFASLKDLDLVVADTHLTIPASCITSVQNNENEESGNQGISFDIKAPCSEQLSELTKMNIGKELTISYGGQIVQKAFIASRLSFGFTLTTKGRNMMVIRQIIADAAPK